MLAATDVRVQGWLTTGCLERRGTFPTTDRHIPVGFGEQMEEFAGAVGDVLWGKVVRVYWCPRWRARDERSSSY